MSFSKQLDAFVSGTQEKINKTVKGATVRAAADVITATPVDTGAARGNWQASVDTPKSGVLDTQDKSGLKALGSITKAVPDEAGSVVYISNSLPYIRRLEYGHSDQAPEGMVRVTAAQWPRIVKEEAAKHK